ncbi:hypothetical protein SH611_17720 [Geminicoccaceae bacterium 1502E]|nr:hypothetical protein [Geminicoccaceae bacterium 1502E]
MRRILCVLALLPALATAGCASLDDRSGERTLAGAAIGGAGGAALGLLTGGIVGKAALGAVAGAAGGLTYDQIQKNK